MHLCLGWSLSGRATVAVRLHTKLISLVSARHNTARATPVLHAQRSLIDPFGFLGGQELPSVTPDVVHSVLLVDRTVHYTMGSRFLSACSSIIVRSSLLSLGTSSQQLFNALSSRCVQRAVQSAGLTPAFTEGLYSLRPTGANASVAL